ncbi:uncharacterized protein KQ657_000345 [Scheffersomyces spartinae]|uniref:PHD-type domain-containing protein n=1 Tax=Scheffersomyces spartinae TaxID=45513 RepID=A0A9P7V929_9ASCO|nr:uncharacterized protein KQ657_000345 [Scheffersomyces spartinae]KAG7193660.1 hypothetical protein KQ657_000345 [Scheffersomyces spartinae]
MEPINSKKPELPSDESNNHTKGIPKRSRGRPRKAKENGLDSIPLDTTSSNVATTPKRSRGRPKKIRSNGLDPDTIIPLLNSPNIVENTRPIGSTRRGRKPLNRNIQSDNNEPISAFDLVPPSQPIYTGLPLEEGPTSKIKKESLWSLRKKLNGRNSRESSILISNSSSMDEDSSGSRVSPSPSSAIEDDYMKKLRTSKSEALTRESSMRSSPLNVTIRYSPKSAKHNFLKDLSQTPKPDLNYNGDTTTTLTKRTSSTKKAKVWSPKKTSLAGLAPRGSILNAESETMDPMLNEDFCTTCGGAGMFICCETCPRSFHFLCTDPPIETLPEHSWICRECMAKTTPPKQWKDIGLFGSLLNALQFKGPKAFQLPRNMRENSFLGVTTGENGDYMDLTMKPILSYAKANGSQIPGFNKTEALDIDSLYDKEGKPYLCHKCGNSGTHNRTLIHCDYCPLVWHLDCLNEPMCIPKTIGTKWRCPNHADSLLPPSHVWNRRLTNATVNDVALHNHFARIASLNNIFIKFPDQEYLNEDKQTLLSEYLGYEREDFAKFDTNYIESSIKRDRVKDGDDPNEHSQLNYATSAGISAPMSSKQVKIIKISNSDNNQSFIYRIPESLVVLDFVSKVKGSYKQSVLDTVDSYDIRTRLETNHSERNALEGLQVLNNSTRNNALDIAELVKVALKNEPASPPIKKEEEEEEEEAHEHPPKLMSHSEIEQLEAVRELIQRAGYEKLMSFLNPYKNSPTE